MDFFGAVLFPSPSGVVSFVVLPLMSALPHGISFIALPHDVFFIPSIFSKTIRSLSFCQETSKGRLDYCVHLL